MFEATLVQGVVLKKIVEAIKDLVQDVNVDCNDAGMAMQAMDNSHVALVALLLRADAFDPYRCDHALTLGLNMVNFAKILRCAGNDDHITLRAEDRADTLALSFDSDQHERHSEYTLKLMEINAEHLEVPESEYDATVHMSSAEFQRICRDLLTLSEEVTIEAVKGTVTFTANGDIGSGHVVLKQNTAVDREEDATIVDLQGAVRLTFSLKYLAHFTKTTSLAARVSLSLHAELPLMVEYKMEDYGYIRYYLAPKLDT